MNLTVKIFKCQLYVIIFVLLVRWSHSSYNLSCSSTDETNECSRYPAFQCRWFHMAESAPRLFPRPAAAPRTDTTARGAGSSREEDPGLTLSRSRGWVQHAAPQDASPPKYQRETRFSVMMLGSNNPKREGGADRETELHRLHWHAPAAAGHDSKQEIAGANRHRALGARFHGVGVVWRSDEGGRGAENKPHSIHGQSVFKETRKTAGSSRRPRCACLFKTQAPPPEGILSEDVEILVKDCACATKEQQLYKSVLSFLKIIF